MAGTLSNPRAVGIVIRVRWNWRLWCIGLIDEPAEASGHNRLPVGDQTVLLSGEADECEFAASSAFFAAASSRF